MIKTVVKDIQISDHFGVHCNLGQKPKLFRKEITFRKMKALSATKFEDFNASFLPSILSLDDVVDAVAGYNHGISDLFDRYAPIVTKNSPHPSRDPIVQQGR